MRYSRALITLALALVLAACGGGAPAATTAPSTPSAAPSQTPNATATAAPTDAPIATDTPAPTKAPVVTDAPPTPTDAVADSPAWTLARTQYLGLPQGVTPDGFPFLGQPDAPVTLIDYSDFL
jgi:protein-disulfide isomerase